MEGYRDNWHPFAKSYIQKVEDTLMQMGCFEEVDKFNLDLLGDSLSLYLKGKEELDKYGLLFTSDSGRKTANPCMQLVKSQQGVIIQLMKELSISLRQRRFLQRDSIIDNDPMDEFLNKMEMMN